MAMATTSIKAMMKRASFILNVARPVYHTVGDRLILSIC